MNSDPKRFRVAFSFSGEKREFVSETAGILSRRFGEAAVLYDKYHQAELDRGDSGYYLPALYHNDSELIVVVFSGSYEEKEWCGLEWDAIYDLLMQRKHDKVMLCRFDRATGRGLYSTSIYEELDATTPEEFARTILRRLATNEGKPRDYYLGESEEVSQRHQNRSHIIFEPCRFDLDNMTEKSMRVILTRNGLIGLVLRCYSITLLKQFCQRLKLELGLGNITVREPLIVNPKFRPVELAVADILRYRKLLDVQHILLAIHISDADSVQLFWSGISTELSWANRHKLIILLAVGEDCALPAGTVALDTPLFERFHAYRWAREVVSAMKWPEDFIEFWVESMVVECGLGSAELYPEHVYVHLDETTNFIRNNPNALDFRAELKRRERIYVSS